jgi:ATP-dependent DNA ligase
MEAQLVKELPETDGWQFEPKWDGFRGVLENDGEELALWSRNGRPLLRYFPELRPLGDLLPPHSALDGEIVIARDGVLKVKPHKTADCVIVGVRWKEKPTRIATLLLGLYNEEKKLDYVGSAAVAASKHKEIFERIEPLLKDAPDRGFSEPNRWGTGELQESAVRPELVAEVRYDKVQGNRFRHGSRFIRFRDDKDPDQCTWREVRPARRKDDPTFESLLAS